MLEDDTTVFGVEKELDSGLNVLYIQYKQK
jgi:hypothetical protein